MAQRNRQLRVSWASMVWRKDTCSRWLCDDFGGLGEMIAPIPSSTVGLISETAQEELPPLLTVRPAYDHERDVIVLSDAWSRKRAVINRTAFFDLLASNLTGKKIESTSSQLKSVLEQK